MTLETLPKLMKVHSKYNVHDNTKKPKFYLTFVYQNKQLPTSTSFTNWSVNCKNEIIFKPHSLIFLGHSNSWPRKGYVTHYDFRKSAERNWDLHFLQ